MTIRQIFSLILLTGAGLFTVGCGTTSESTAIPAEPAPPAAETTTTSQPVVDGPAEEWNEDPRAHILRVTVTNQGYDYFNPWRKQAPSSKSGIGVVLANHNILVTARLVENATYVELENLLEGEKGPATVAFVDYAANLALLKPDSAEVMAGLQAIDVVDAASIGDEVTAWQFEDNGTPFLTDGVVRTVELGNYPYADMNFMVYNIELSLTTGSSSYTIPVVRDNELCGLLMSYNGNTKIVQLVASPVIRHFLEDQADGSYDGFPLAGFGVASLEDKQLRNFVGVGDQELEGGVFVSRVRPGSPAEDAGLMKGDVLVSVANHVIDKHGEFDDPIYGKMALSFLISTRSYVGDVVPVQILRKGEPMTLNMTMGPLKMDEYPVRPFEFDQQPQFIMVGGLVFMELNRQFLMSWGAGYEQNAPNRLVYLEKHQWELMEPGQRQVLMTRVLPSTFTNGYQQFLFLPVTQCNGQEINSIHDLAEALKTPQGPFHEFNFSEQPYTMYLAAQAIGPVNQQLQRLYQLPYTQHLRQKP